METYKEMKERHEKELIQCGCILQVLNKSGGVKIELTTVRIEGDPKIQSLRFCTPDADGRFQEMFGSLKEGDNIRLIKE